MVERHDRSWACAFAEVIDGVAGLGEFDEILLLMMKLEGSSLELMAAAEALMLGKIRDGYGVQAKSKTPQPRGLVWAARLGRWIRVRFST
jgi:hypothetical protein